MKPGIIFPTSMEGATFNADVGGWIAGYDMANMGDLVRPSKIARANGAGAHNFIVNFPAKTAVRAIALVGHNAAFASTIRVSCHFATMAGGTLMYDSGVQSFYPAGYKINGYRQIRPFILPADVSCQSVYFRLSANDVPYEIEGVEIGRFWEWPGIGYGRELGIEQDGSEIALAGGASYRPDGPKPRKVSGSVDYMKMTETSTTGLDFHSSVDIQKPFVWAEDFDDPETWFRKCLLVRNQGLSPMVGSLYRHDRYPIELIEHLR